MQADQVKGMPAQNLRAEHAGECIAYPAQIMIHQAMGGAQGQAEDIKALRGRPVAGACRLIVSHGFRLKPSRFCKSTRTS